MRPTTKALWLNSLLWLILILVLLGPIIPDENGKVYPIIFLFVLVAITLHIISIIKLVKLANRAHQPKSKFEEQF